MLVPPPPLLFFCVMAPLNELDEQEENERKGIQVKATVLHVSTVSAFVPRSRNIRTLVISVVHSFA